MRLLVRRIFYFETRKGEKMKKVILLAVLSLMVALLFSCGEKTEEPLYIVKQTYTDGSGTTTFTYSYNADYKIIRQEVDAGGEASTVSEYGYDENGYQNYQKVVANSGLVQEIFMTNDSYGRVIKRKIVTNYNGKVTEVRSTLEYIDSNGSYVETSSSGAVNTFTFDEHGNLLSTKSEGLTEQTVTYENKYEDGLLKETTLTTVTKTRTTVQTIKYEYDKHGNNIKSTLYDEQGSVKVTETFEYSKNPEIIK